MAIKEPGRADEISIELAARLLMIGAERVRQLIKAGFIARTKPGFTTIPSAVQGYIKFLKESAQENTQTASASKAQEARAREINMRVDREERNLISQEEAQLALSMACGMFVEEMGGLAARCTRDLATRRIIETEVHGAKTRLSKAFEKLSGFVRGGGNPPETLR